MDTIGVQLAGLLGTGTLILGVGNRMRGDDGAGPLLVDLLRDRGLVRAVDCGVAPENYVEKVVRMAPETVLVVDAVDFGVPPGEARLIAPEQISEGGLSTHAGSLKLVCDYLHARLTVRIFLLGIQPERVSLGDGVGERVRRTVESLAAIIEQAASHA
jgi:hydrogenase 3 maturation protease